MKKKKTCENHVQMYVEGPDVSAPAFMSLFKLSNIFKHLQTEKQTEIHTYLVSECNSTFSMLTVDCHRSLF